jgi:hypothetical protein
LDPIGGAILYRSSDERFLNIQFSLSTYLAARDTIASQKEKRQLLHRETNWASLERMGQQVAVKIGIQQ